jgi:hypothetical protein
MSRCGEQSESRQVISSVSASLRRQWPRGTPPGRKRARKNLCKACVMARRRAVGRASLLLMALKDRPVSSAIERRWNT